MKSLLYQQNNTYKIFQHFIMTDPPLLSYLRAFRTDLDFFCGTMLGEDGCLEEKLPPDIKV